MSNSPIKTALKRPITALQAVGGTLLAIIVGATVLNSDGSKQESWSEKVDRLATQIVNVNVTPEQLQELGYLNARTHGTYLVNCRERLVGKFNDHSQTLDGIKKLAHLVDECAYSRNTYPPHKK